VAIPARDEAERIANCLHALAVQTVVPDHIVLLLNNCTDPTAAVARRAPRHPATRLHILAHTLPPAVASAGHARRLAMEAAAALAGPSGLLLTTDADSRADPQWIATARAAIAAGADAVAGAIELDPADWDKIPYVLHADDARECAYDALCDEITAILDPDPADPWPRHTSDAGASLAVTASAYARAGGIPDLPTGEDRAFAAALRRIDARIRHAPECQVFVSGRTEGRAQGGMADTIRRRLLAPDPYIDDRLEPVEACARRAGLHRLARAAWRSHAALLPLARQAGLDPARLRSLLDRPHFGAAWAAIEAVAPGLGRVRVPVADLARQTARARELRDALRETTPRGKTPRGKTPREATFRETAFRDTTLGERTSRDTTSRHTPAAFPALAGAADG
jgi:GT2 family glycosyltransferase